MTIVLSVGDLEWPTNALADTGSTFCLFSRGAGEALSIDFRDPNLPRRMMSIAGARRLAVFHTVTLSLPPFDDLWWQAEVGFFDDEERDLPFGILGNEGFFDRWVVSFNRANGYFAVEQADAWQEAAGIQPLQEFRKLDPDWERPRGTDAL